VHRGVIRICHRSLEEDLRSFAVSRLRQIEVHRLAAAVNGTEQVTPTAGDPNIGFIDVPGRALALQVAGELPIHFRPIGLCPAPDGGVINSEATLCSMSSSSWGGGSE
jgi:hypothetical protein